MKGIDVRMSLTTKTVEGLKPEKEVRVFSDALTRNLKFTVHPTGRKVWGWQGRVEGKVRTFTLGRFPKYSLKEARAWAANINDMNFAGEPLPPMTRAERALAKADIASGAKSERNFDWLFSLYMREEGDGLASGKERWRIYHKDIKPFIGEMAIDEIKHVHLVKILRAKKEAGAPVVANTIQSYLRRVFKWAVTTGADLTGLEHDPAQRLVKLTTPKERERFLTDYEIGIFFRALPKIDAFIGEPLIASLYLGLRRGEVFRLRWDEVNFDTGDIEIEGSRVKNGRALVLFMPETISTMLRKRHESTGRFGFVWPAIGSQSVDDFDEEKTGKASTAFTKPMNRLNLECRRLAGNDGKVFPRFTIHDLRRTLSTGMHALKDENRRSLVHSDVVERVLNHTIGGVRRVYNRHDYYEEKMVALQAWADHLDRIRIAAAIPAMTDCL